MHTCTLRNADKWFGFLCYLTRTETFEMQQVVKKSSSSGLFQPSVNRLHSLKLV